MICCDGLTVNPGATQNLRRRDRDEAAFASRRGPRGGCIHFAEAGDLSMLGFSLSISGDLSI